MGRIKEAQFDLAHDTIRYYAEMYDTDTSNSLILSDVISDDLDLDEWYRIEEYMESEFGVSDTESVLFFYMTENGFDHVLSLARSFVGELREDIAWEYAHRGESIPTAREVRRLRRSMNALHICEHICDVWGMVA